MNYKLMLTTGASLLAGCFSAYANPTDSGTAGYTQIYVDSAQNCHLDAGGSNTSFCGATPTNAFTNLREALSKAGPGSEVIVAGYAPIAANGKTAYYNYDEGIPVTPVGSPHFAEQQFLTLPMLEGNASTAKTLIRGWNGMEKPRVRGTMRLNGWQPVSGQSNLYSLNWNVVASGAATCTATNSSGQCTAYSYPVVGPQQLFRGAIQLQQVGGTVYLGSSAESGTGPTWMTQTATRKVGRITPVGTSPWLNLTANQFYYDISTHTVYVKTASSVAQTEYLEASVQQFLLSTTNVKNVTIKDLIFERSNGSAFSPQNSAVTINGNGNTLSGVTVQQADAICLLLQGNNQRVELSTIQQCGQMGIAATGTNHQIHKNKVLYNNAKGFDEWWAGAGIKLIGDASTTISNITISENTVAFNSGHGIWLDTTPTNITVTGNTSAFNGAYNSRTDGTFYAQIAGTGGIGLFIEAVNNNTITNNSVIGNVNQGMQLKGKCNTITGNVFMGNWSLGLAQLVDSRVTPDGGSCAPNTQTYANTIQSNAMYWNDEAGGTAAHYYFQIGLLPSNAQVSANTYCGTPGRPYFVMGSTGYYTFDAWQKQGTNTQQIDTTASGSTANTGVYASGNALFPKPGDYVLMPIWWATAVSKGEQGVASLLSYLKDNCKGAPN